MSCADSLNLVGCSATFEYEKNKNIELVEQLKGTEKNLIGMAREVEYLRAEIQNVEKRIQGNFLASVCLMSCDLIYPCIPIFDALHLHSTKFSTKCVWYCCCWTQRLD